MNQFMQMFTNLTTLTQCKMEIIESIHKPITSDFVSLGLFKNTPDAKWEWSIEGYYRKQANVSDFINGAELTISNCLKHRSLQGNSRSYGANYWLIKRKGVMTGWLSLYLLQKHTANIGPYPALQQINSGQWFPANIDKPRIISIWWWISSRRSTIWYLLLTNIVPADPYTAPVSFYKADLNIYRSIPIATMAYISL